MERELDDQQESAEHADDQVIVGNTVKQLEMGHSRVAGQTYKFDHTIGALYSRWLAAA